jgi:hypothetical protein
MFRISAAPQNFLGLDRSAARAALGEQESQQVAKGIRIGAVAQERALPLNSNQSLVFQLLEVVGQG